MNVSVCSGITYVWDHSCLDTACLSKTLSAFRPVDRGGCSELIFDPEINKKIDTFIILKREIGQSRVQREQGPTNCSIPTNRTNNRLHSFRQKSGGWSQVVPGVFGAVVGHPSGCPRRICGVYARSMTIVFPALACAATQSASPTCRRPMRPAYRSG